MSTADRMCSRPDKEDDARTVLYEIDLLNFARKRLLSPQPWWEKLDECLYLETFLLHYRNLIEFFGKQQNLRDDDLSISRPERIWPGHVPDKSTLDFMTRPDLWEKYDTSDNKEAISKYLHHCTAQRTEAKAWDVNAMFEELRPTIERFESLLPGYKHAAVLTPGRGPGQTTLDGNSTISTRTLDLGQFPDK